MDFIFNKGIPISIPSKIIIPPTGKTWINGLAFNYSKTYQRKYLEGYMTEYEYDRFIKKINFVTENYWPCCFCFYFGYLLAPCTLGMFLCDVGLSFCCPFICIRECKQFLDEAIKKLNDKMLRPRKLRAVIEYGCSTSWIAIYNMNMGENLLKNEE